MSVIYMIIGVLLIIILSAVIISFSMLFIEEHYNKKEMQEKRLSDIEDELLELKEKQRQQEGFGDY
ncbi:hypothetical protein ACPUEX_22525 [Enterobacter vonholyi]